MQAKFTAFVSPPSADFLMISVRTLQKWEQGQRNPDGAAHALLRVMEREPDAVLRALHD
jgi:putative transcriptional regulator